MRSRFPESDTDTIRKEETLPLCWVHSCDSDERVKRTNLPNLLDSGSLDPTARENYHTRTTFPSQILRGVPLSLVWVVEYSTRVGGFCDLHRSVEG